MNDEGVVDHTVRIAARPETVWEFLIDPAGLAQWWGDAEIDPVAGGLLRVHMQEGPRPVMRGQIVELIPFERLVFTFGWEDGPGAPAIPPGGSRVTITLVPDGDGTVLRLRHDGVPGPFVGETRDGWGGLALRLVRVCDFPGRAASSR